MVAKYKVSYQDGTAIKYSDNFYEALHEAIRHVEIYNEPAFVFKKGNKRPLIGFNRIDSDEITVIIHVPKKEFESTNIINLIDNWPVNR